MVWHHWWSIVIKWEFLAISIWIHLVSVSVEERGPYIERFGAGVGWIQLVSEELFKNGRWWPEMVVSGGCFRQASYQPTLFIYNRRSGKHIRVNFIFCAPFFISFKYNLIKSRPHKLDTILKRKNRFLLPLCRLLSTLGIKYHISHCVPNRRSQYCQ